MRRRTKRGALPRGARFVTLHFWMLDQDAIKELSGNAFKLLVLLAMRYTGSNNGAISMSVREGAEEVGCCINTAAKSFHELEQAGFIRATQRGSFDWKKRHATTWRLTWLDYGDEPATKEFMRHDRGRRMLINGCLVDPNQKKNAVSHGDTDSIPA